ncbi:hypothetical protein AAVH_19211 [Aphelenchoides avenae]|nr:hypothetical protein AAVH_19211 [Aphelenchus avenae]
MSKRPHSSQEPTSASVDLVKRLKDAANDAVLLREIVKSNDTASVADAIAALLTGGSSSASTGPKLRKTAHNRTRRSLPAENFVEVVLFADRDTLDTMQLVCSYFLTLIRELELTQLALRAISRVEIGKFLWRREDRFDGWLPIVDVIRRYGAERELVPKTVHQLMPCLRMSFCRSVCIDLGGVSYAHATFSNVCGMVFDDLAAPSTFVGTLDIRLPPRNMELALRGIEAFKSVKTLRMEPVPIDDDIYYELAGEEPLDEKIFIPALKRGVRHIEVISEDDRGAPANTAAALSFGFAEPAAGGDRSLLGIACDIGADFLELIKQKVAELDATRHLDFTFKLGTVSPDIDPDDYEKYQGDDGQTVLVDDLENHVNVELKQTEDSYDRNVVEIHVFSSV